MGHKGQLLSPAGTAVCPAGDWGSPKVEGKDFSLSSEGMGVVPLFTQGIGGGHRGNRLSSDMRMGSHIFATGVSRNEPGGIPSGDRACAAGRLEVQAGGTRKCGCHSANASAAASTLEP